MTETDLETVVSVRRTLHWAIFLCACMGLILVIDLQLKRSIVRHAIELADLINRHTVTVKVRADAGRAGTVGAAGGDGDHGDVHRGGDVVGDSPVATADDYQGDPVPVQETHGGRGGAERQAGDAG